MTNKARIQKIFTILAHTYKTAHIELKYDSPWELLVAVMLSAQCTDKQVNIVTAKLFKKYTTLTDYAAARTSEFEADIRSTGFYHNKTKHIIETAIQIQNKYNGLVPEKMEELLTLPGVARKTANVVLYNAFKKNEGIAVDTHVLRLSMRLQLIPHNVYNNPVKTEKMLQQLIPKDRWGSITYQLIDHGRAICQAKKPLCSICKLQTLCPSAKLFLTPLV